MTLNQLALLVTVLSGALFLLFRNWRLTLIALSAQYLAVFVWVWEIWGLELAAIKLVAGWMAVAILGATLREAAENLEDDDTGILFKFFVYVILLLVAWSFGAEVGGWLPDITAGPGAAGIILIGTAMLRFGFHSRALQIVLCVLFFFSGFELWFAFFDDTALTAVLLGVSNLAIALVGAYLHGQQTEMPAGSLK